MSNPQAEVTISNTGVLSVTAGAGVEVDQPTGDVTITAAPGAGAGVEVSGATISTLGAVNNADLTLPADLPLDAGAVTSLLVIAITPGATYLIGWSVTFTSSTDGGAFEASAWITDQVSVDSNQSASGTAYVSSGQVPWLTLSGTKIYTVAPGANAISLQGYTPDAAVSVTAGNAFIGALGATSLRIMRIS